MKRPRSATVHPLLYQKIPVKVAGEWDTDEVGNVQVDYVEHRGRSTGGQYIHTAIGSRHRHWMVGRKGDNGANPGSNV